jgi:hypothetical protein
VNVGQHARWILETVRYKGRGPDPDVIDQLPEAVRGEVRDAVARLVGFVAGQNGTAAKEELEQFLSGFDAYATSVGVDAEADVVELESLASIGERIFK